MLKYTMQYNNTYFLYKNVFTGVRWEETLPIVRYMSLSAPKSEALMMSIYTWTSVFN